MSAGLQDVCARSHGHPLFDFPQYVHLRIPKAILKRLQCSLLLKGLAKWGDWPNQGYAMKWAMSVRIWNSWRTGVARQHLRMQLQGLDSWAVLIPWTVYLEVQFESDQLRVCAYLSIGGVAALDLLWLQNMCEEDWSQFCQYETRNPWNLFYQRKAMWRHTRKLLLHPPHFHLPNQLPLIHWNRWRNPRGGTTNRNVWFLPFSCLQQVQPWIPSGLSLQSDRGQCVCGQAAVRPVWGEASV